MAGPYRKSGPVRILARGPVSGPRFFGPVRGPDFWHGFWSGFLVRILVRIFSGPVRGTDFGPEMTWSGPRYGFWSEKIRTGADFFSVRSVVRKKISKN